MQRPGESGVQSMAISAVLCRLESGELGASIGIDGNAKVQTEAPEFGWIERHSDNESTATAGLLFALLGTLQPEGVSIRQKVGVIHHGLDLCVLLRAVPELRDTEFFIH